MAYRTWTQEEINKALCYQIMREWEFDNDRVIEWETYASRHRQCPKCMNPPNSPCFNMADVNYNSGRPPELRVAVRVNKHPHPERCDWTRALEGLKARDYYLPEIEQKLLRELEQRASGVTPPKPHYHLEETRDMPDWLED